MLESFSSLFIIFFMAPGLMRHKTLRDLENRVYLPMLWFLRKKQIGSLTLQRPGVLHQPPLFLKTDISVTPNPFFMKFYDLSSNFIYFQMQKSFFQVLNRVSVVTSLSTHGNINFFPIIPVLLCYLHLHYLFDKNISFI